ncbi:MAG: biotin--[acetyl-CoA-carboxylase] ligase [Promethearchaeota archaeon]
MPDFTKKIMLKSKLCPKIYSYDEVGSTNYLARKLIENKNDIGFVIVAVTQTAGKGQNERVWESPKGGLWCSIAIQPKIDLTLLRLVPILSAVAISNALETFNIKTMLKWPNDILIRHNLRKIGGILAESKVSQYFLDYLIIGIGLNINNTLGQYSSALQDHITTIYEEIKYELDLELLLQRIIFQIENSFETLNIYGAQPICNEWKQKDNILGMDIIVQGPECKYQGRAVDISPYGQLILEIPDSDKVKISNGTVYLLRNKTE